MRTAGQLHGSSKGVVRLDGPLMSFPRKWEIDHLISYRDASPRVLCGRTMCIAIALAELPAFVGDDKTDEDGASLYVEA